MSISRRHATLGRMLVAVATLATLAAAPALTACSDDAVETIGAPDLPIAGTYALEKVNDQALPFGEGNEFWDAMTLTLGADHTIHVTLGWHETDDAGAIVDQGTDTFSGSYTAQGNRLTLALEDDEAVSAVLDGDVLTVTADGNVMVFRRR